MTPVSKPGQGFEFDGRTYTVVKMEHNRIAQVRIEQITASQIAGGPEVGEAENG